MLGKLLWGVLWLIAGPALSFATLGYGCRAPTFEFGSACSHDLLAAFAGFAALYWVLLSMVAALIRSRR